MLIISLSIHSFPLGKAGMGSALFRQIQIQHRYVRCTGFDNFRTLCIAWQMVHGRINLFVHFDEGQVGVGVIFKTKADESDAVSRFTPQIFQSSHLHQLGTQGTHYCILQFTCRGILSRHLHRYLWDSNIGQ